MSGVLSCKTFNLDAWLLFDLTIVYTIHISVQAEKIKIAYPTFLDAWDLRSHMAGHFCL